MPLPTLKSTESKIPADLDPKTHPPSVVLQRLILRGKLPHAVVPYPRFDELGQPIVQVHVRLLTVGEQDLALAEARRYVDRLVSNKAENASRAEELEHNARITELLAVACREPDDPSKPFFRYGVMDVREHCTAEEIGVLANVYAKLMTERLYLNELSENEMESMLRAVAEGTLQYPFSFCSREALEMLLSFAAKRLVEAGAFSTGPSPTS